MKPETKPNQWTPETWADYVNHPDRCTDGTLGHDWSYRAYGSRVAECRRCGLGTDKMNINFEVLTLLATIVGFCAFMLAIVGGAI